MKNFIDFLSSLSKLSDRYHLIVPCKTVNEIPADMTEIDLPASVIEAEHYDTHFSALRASLLNALMVKKLIVNELNRQQQIMVAGPGPNSFLFWLSLIAPATTKYAFFIRGNTLKTVHHIYEGTLLHLPAVSAVRLFQERIKQLCRNNRGQIFLYGDKLRELYGNDNDAHVITPLIDNSMLLSKRPKPQMDPTLPRVLFVGRLSEEKNIFNLIDACILANKRGTPFALTIIGHGRLYNKIKSLSDTDQLKSLINLVGFVPHGNELAKYYDEHDILCLPSRTEGVPRVIVEALSRGLPVLATPVGSIPEIFENQVVLLNGFNPIDILNGIEWCRSHANDLDAMCESGHQAIDRFLIASNAQKVDGLLNQFLLNTSCN